MHSMQISYRHCKSSIKLTASYRICTACTHCCMQTACTPFDLSIQFSTSYICADQCHASTMLQVTKFDAQHACIAATTSRLILSDA